MSQRLSSDQVRQWRAAAVAGLAMFLTALAAGQAFAGQLQIMPTRLGLSSATPSTVLFATNADATDATYQLSVFKWGQASDGSDQLEPTREVLANPAIFTVKHANQQVIRFGLRAEALTTEQSYRVILQELPRPDPQASGIKTLLRISIPLFIPATNPASGMDWTLQTSGKGATLVARNRGNTHVQIIGVQVDRTPDDGAHVAWKGSLYVLPTIARHIDIGGSRPLAPGALYHVRVDTDQGPLTAELRAEPAAPAPNS